MYRRLLLIAVLSSLTAACVPYGGNGYYHRTDVYTADRYGYPGYYRPSYPSNRGYYVVPQQRYYSPPPRHYRPPSHYYRSPPQYYRPAPDHYYKPYPGRGHDRYRQGASRHERDRDGRAHGNWHR
ncbi:hypothetical protein [Pseudomonas sp. DG56-2]|uniref:hypothetical protein n=1 Tax=Pseudomonas sp. DG56-2 TaxID=2320270 RepID=UPI0010A5C4C6|nr:hypothetical protein [Pseudomonas sp. DG56-2]